MDAALLIARLVLVAAWNLPGPIRRRHEALGNLGKTTL
jgi:hypothetical protein